MNDEDPRGDGFGRSWVSNGLVWGSATTWLVRETHTAAPRLAAAALHLWLKNSYLLINGTRSVNPDTVARTDCPLNRKQLRELCGRAGGLRDTVLHLTDRFADGTVINVNMTADPHEVTYSATNAEGAEPVVHQFTRSEIDDLAASLMPWLERHYRRLVLSEGASKPTAPSQ